ncbi:MAG: hypothetical protein ABW321_03000, partial [Polyangiales bacterium]
NAAVGSEAQEDKHQAPGRANPSGAANTREATALNAAKSAADRQAVDEQRRDALHALGESSEANASGQLRDPSAGAAGSGPPVPYTRFASNSDGIGNALKESMPTIRDCYDKFWGHGDQPPSNVRVHIAVEPDPADPTKGKVAVAETVSGALQNGATESCLKSRLTQLSFERPKQIVHATLPLVFAEAQPRAAQSADGLPQH